MNLLSLFFTSASYSYGLSDPEKDNFSARDSISRQNLRNTRKFLMVRNILPLWKSAYKIKVQRKPLNVITLGQTKSDHINRMITITDDFT